jgi:kumamolisin
MPPYRKILLLFAVFLSMAGGAWAVSEPRTMLPESIKALNPAKVRAVRALRREHLGNEIEFQIALRMRDFSKLLARESTGVRISQEELEQRYLPLPADYNAVVQWARDQGLTVTQTDPMRLGVFVKGTIAQIQAATRAQFAEVTVAEGTFTSAVTAPSIPATLANAVLGVNGLQPHIHPHHVQSVQPQIANAPPYLVKEILGAYGASNLGFTGAGETIAILIDTFPASTDLSAFWTHNGIPQSLSNITEIQAVSGALDAISGEETLDSEWTSGIAPDAKIRIYASRDLSFTDLDKGLQRILSDLPNQPSMHELSISLGLGETEVSVSQKITDAQYFLNIANYGVSIFVSSGDDGAVTDGVLQPSYYSSDPSVTGVGGTSLVLYASGAVESETAWYGSGGGVSSYFGRPAWQVGEGVPAGSRRLVPDVASAADPNTGAYVYLQGSAKQIGGTSWAAPTWAGFCALINQARAQNGLGPLGLLGPKIYPLVGTGAFRDITSGNNGGYSTTAGYDMVTGLGTPIMSALLPALSNGGNVTPQITSFTPVAGPVGTAVTISGVNLDRVTGVQFNGQAAQITGTATANSLSTVVPAGATTGPITLITGTTGSVSSAIDFSVVPLPTNDNFANATVISGTVGRATGSNLAATKQPGEPDIGGDPGGASVWWVWTAPANGIYTFNTAGSSFDTTEGVYTGSAVNALTTIGSNDDYGTSVTSSITFTATAGGAYYIAVDGYQGVTGAIVLNWEENSGAPVITNFTPQSGIPGTVIDVTGADFFGTSAVAIGGSAAGFAVLSDTEMTVTVAPTDVTGAIAITGPQGTTLSSANFVVVPPVSNDDFNNATLLSGASGTVTGNNAGATREAGEPEITGNPGGKSIWYEWIPTTSGPVTFTTFGSSFDTLLGIYTGGIVSNLTLIGANDDYGNTVDSSVTFLATAGTPYRIAVDGYNGASGNVVLNWSKDSSLPVITGFSPSSGPPETTIQITGSNFSGVTSVNLGATPLAYTVVSNAQISAMVPVGAATGLISVGNLLGAVNSANPFTVTAAPSNDDFANSIPLAGTTVHVTGANVGATKEPGEPDIAGNPGGASVWWSWTAPSTGVFAVSTQGSSFDTLLGVYTGDAVDALTEVASNDDDPAGGVTSYVTINAVAGTAYRIAVDGLNGASGSISLSIYPQQASTVLYSTGFEAKEGFTAGQPLAGQDGWMTQYTGGNGIVTGFDGMSGQQAYVGYSPPTNPGDGGVFAYHPVDYSPLTTGQPVVKFSVEMAINDSNNGNYDDFQWRLYNSKGHNFFTVDFSNYDLHVYYSEDGGNTLLSTGVQFANNSPMELEVTMDYAHNKWGATLNGSNLVQNKAIRTGSALLDFGDMDAVWQIYDVANPGDNYMLFDNYSIVAGENPTPRITFQPQSQSVVQGNSATLGVVASGQAPLYYQWMLNKKSLVGANSASLTIPDVETVNAGTYSVNVSNEIGLVTSLPARLTVTPQTSIPTITQNPASITVAAGATAVFHAAASGYPAPACHWTFGGNPIPGATSTTLQIKNVQASSIGSYAFVASNALGSGTSLPATLAVGNSFASQKGNFNGMVHNGLQDLIGSGLLKVTMGAGGSFTGSVLLAGKSYHMAGYFSPEGEWQGTVGKLAGGVPVTVNLQLALGGTNEVTGIILAGGTTENVTALRDNFSQTGILAPESPAYTMTLTGTSTGLPEGIGYAAITVDQAGNVRAAGKLGDSSAFSFSSVVSDSGAWPFYVSLYKSMGFIGGTLAFQSSGLPLDGTLYWLRPAAGGSGGYSAGFAGDVAAAGYVYTPPKKNAAAIPLDGQHQGTITFSGSLLNSSTTGQLSLGPDNVLAVTGNSGIKFSLQPSTGVFSGTVNAAPGLSKLPFYGVLLQPLDGGSGLLQSPTISGQVQITSP